MTASDTARRWVAGGADLVPSTKRPKDPLDGAADVAIRAEQRKRDRDDGHTDGLDPTIPREELASWAEELGVSIDPPARRRSGANVRKEAAVAAADGNGPPPTAPKRTRSVPPAIAAHRAERDRKIAEAARAGVSFRQIAADHGVSRQRVGQIAAAAGVRRDPRARYDLRAT